MLKQYFFYRLYSKVLVIYALILLLMTIRVHQSHIFFPFSALCWQIPKLTCTNGNI